MSGLSCAKCGATTDVLDSRVSPDGTYVRRRRSCPKCRRRVTTIELPVPDSYNVTQGGLEVMEQMAKTVAVRQLRDFADAMERSVERPAGLQID